MTSTPFPNKSIWKEEKYSALVKKQYMNNNQQLSSSTDPSYSIYNFI